MSASLALEPPFGGIAPLPLIAFAVRASMPCAIRGAHAVLSPTLGAPAIPGVWQVLQICAKSGGAAVAAAGAVVAAAAAAFAATSVFDLPGSTFGGTSRTCALSAACGVDSGLPAFGSGIGEPPAFGAAAVEPALPGTLLPAPATVVVVVCVVAAGAGGSGKLPPAFDVMKTTARAIS